METIYMYIIFGGVLSYAGIRLILVKDKIAKIIGITLLFWVFTFSKTLFDIGSIHLENKIIVTEYHTGLGIEAAKIKQAANAKKRLQRVSK